MTSRAGASGGLQAPLLLPSPAAGQPLHPLAEEDALEAVEGVGFRSFRGSGLGEERPFRVPFLEGSSNGGRVCDHVASDLGPLEPGHWASVRQREGDLVTGISSLGAAAHGSRTSAEREKITRGSDTP